MTDVSAHHYIDTPEDLQKLCSQLREKPYVIVDTEFLRERTYRPELCLVQIKHENIIACIDTIAIKDLSDLTELLLDEKIVKVFHVGIQRANWVCEPCEGTPGY